MNTTITKDQMLLKDNEVQIWSEDRRNMLYTTDKFYHGIGVKTLQREWFVKGDDVEEMAQKFIENTSDFDGADDGWIRLFKNIFKAGYNAKKGEFTREQMRIAIYDAVAFGRVFKPNSQEIIEWGTKYICSLQTLTLPQSLTLNKDNEIVKIEF